MGKSQMYLLRYSVPREKERRQTLEVAIPATSKDQLNAEATWLAERSLLKAMKENVITDTLYLTVTLLRDDFHVQEWRSPFKFHTRHLDAVQITELWQKAKDERSTIIPNIYECGCGCGHAYAWAVIGSAVAVQAMQSAEVVVGGPCDKLHAVIFESLEEISVWEKNIKAENKPENHLTDLISNIKSQLSKLTLNS